MTGICFSTPEPFRGPCQLRSLIGQRITKTRARRLLHDWAFRGRIRGLTNDSLAHSPRRFIQQHRHNWVVLYHAGNFRKVTGSLKYQDSSRPQALRNYCSSTKGSLCITIFKKRRRRSKGLCSKLEPRLQVTLYGKRIIPLLADYNLS